MTTVEGVGIPVPAPTLQPVPSSVSPPSRPHPQGLNPLSGLSIASTTTAMLPRLEKPVYSSPPPATSNPENNACRLIEYRGAKVAAFNVDGRELICLPQAFELFLKHLVGGLHTVYTKLKRLDVIPVVCNVEQVRILRGLGAIQPGVNRCKLISPKEFDILYEDCTNSSARPGRPPKRSSIMAPSVDALEKLKKSRLEGADYPYPPTSLMDLKKSPLFGNGYQYPPHLAHIPFMPIGHPAIMNFAMANHLGLRHQELLNMAERNQTATDLSSPSRPKEEREDSLRSEHNNNNNSNKASLDIDKPLNLEIHHRVPGDDRRHSGNTDKDSVSSGHSDMLHNGHLDLSTKAAIHSGNEDMDADDESEDDKDDEDELDTTDMSTSGAPNGEMAEKSTNHSMPFSSQLLNTENSGISSVETLLLNIQGLLKVAAENARHREQQTNFEKAELKMEILKERELRESLEKQLMDETKNKVLLQKRLKKEKRAKRRLQEQLDGSEGPMHLPLLPSSQGSSAVEDHLKQAQENLRILNDSASQDADIERTSHSPLDGDRKLPDSRGSSGIQNLMETFLSSAQKTATSCNGAVGYIHSPVIKQTETA